MSSDPSLPGDPYPHLAPSWWEALSPPWQACLEEAWMACCAGSIPIGAVVTDAGGQILSRGRNRLREVEGPDLLPGAGFFGHPLAHAETNALAHLLSLGRTQDLDPHTCLLYTTTEPCPLCMGALYMSGVRTVYYASRDPYAGSANLLGTTPYLSRKPVRAVGTVEAGLEELIFALAVHFELERGDHPMLPVIFDTWDTAIPGITNYGRRLFDAGLLLTLRGQQLPAGPAMDRLISFLFP